MGQIKLIITVDETEYARLREKAEALQREPGAVVGELITQWLAEQPPRALDARAEGNEPFEAWQHKHQADFDRLLALPIEERRDLVRRATGKLKLPAGVSAAQYVRELRTDWDTRLARPEQGKSLPLPTDE